MNLFFRPIHFWLKITITSPSGFFFAGNSVKLSNNFVMVSVVYSFSMLL